MSKARGGKPWADDDVHCSHGGDRSWTDPVSNWTLISGARLDRDAAHMMQLGKFPAHLLAPFVHELVHHWSFHSPLGLALALLQLRARREGALLVKGGSQYPTDGQSIKAILEDTVRYESAVTLLRPLAEGLALFAEFDMVPGTSTAASLVATWIGLCFANPEDMVKEGGRDPAIRAALARHRLSNACADRKSNLLASDFTCKSGGYLPGYLAVKDLWFTLAVERGCRRLLDKDLFLLFVRAFFYEDLAFVAALLDDEVEATDAVGGISEYFQMRYLALLATTDAEVEAFEQFVASRTTDSRTTTDAVFPLGDVDGSSLEKGRTLLKSLQSEVEDFEGVSDLDARLRRADHWLIAQRDLMCVGSFRDHVRVNGHGRVLVGHAVRDESAGIDIPVLALDALPGVLPGEGEGLVEYFISPSGWYRHCVVSLGGSTVGAIALSPDMPKELLDQVCHYRPDSSKYIVMKKQIQGAIEDIMTHSGVRTWLDACRKGVAGVTGEFYDMRCVSHLDPDRAASCLEKMREFGVLAVVDNSAEMLRALSRASVVASVCSSKALVDSIFACEDVSLDSLLTECDRAAAAHGVPLVMYNHEGILVLV